MKPFILSEKLKDLKCEKCHQTFFFNWAHLDDIREAVKRLKEVLIICPDPRCKDCTDLRNKIDKVFGEKIVYE